jgi:hypothetical protein
MTNPFSVRNGFVFNADHRRELHVVPPNADRTGLIAQAPLDFQSALRESFGTA